MAMVIFEFGNNVVDGVYNITGSTTASRATNSTPVEKTQLRNVLSLGRLSVGGASILEIDGQGNTFSQLYDVVLEGTAKLSVVDGEFNVGSPDQGVKSTYTQSGGTFTGASTMRVYGTTNWSGGTIDGTSSATDKFIAEGALNISGVSEKNLGKRTLYANAGSVWVGDGNLKVDECVIVNAASKTWSIQGNADIDQLGLLGKCEFINNGVLENSGDTFVEAKLTNNSSGEINILSGKLDFVGGVTSAGKINIAKNATIGFEGTQSVMGPVAGEGSVYVHDAGKMTFSGVYEVYGKTTISDCAGASEATRASIYFEKLPKAMGGLVVEGAAVVEFNPASGGAVTINDTVTLRERIGCPQGSVADNPQLIVSAPITVLGAYTQSAKNAWRLGSQKLTLNGTVSWSGGRLKSQSVTEVNGAMSIDTSTYDVAIDAGHHLDTKKSVTWTGSNDIIVESSAAKSAVDPQSGNLGYPDCNRGRHRS